ncbi:ABC transporter ATP-binding protein [Gordonia sp. NPDC003425]
MIDYESVTVQYGDFLAIPPMNLTIAPGEFFTFLGPSGCGKSTALRALAGFAPVTTGEIRIEGERVNDKSPDKRDIGMVFQNYALFPSMTVRENIGFGLRVKKTDKTEIDERVRSIAREVELSDEQLDKEISALSGGQQQRVAIARALITRPKILLLDEPLSNLDAKLRAQLRVQLKDLQTEFGITTVYVTHDQEEALMMSDRIAVMNKGNIEQIGSGTEIYNDSNTEFVCNFIGEANKLTRSTVEHLNAHGGSLDPKKSSYIRVEKVDIEPLDAPVDGVRIDSEIMSKAFHGQFSSYRLEVFNDVVKGVERARGSAGFEIGDKVSVGIRPEFVLQYEQPHELEPETETSES